MPETPCSSGSDERLERILADYLHAVEAGAAQDDREALLREHPDLADELRSFFRNRDAIAEIVEPAGRLPLPETIGAERHAVGVGNHRPLLRRLRDPRRARPRRHGHRLPRPAGQPEPGRRRQDDPRGRAGDGSADVQRFRREAEAVARLDHPNIVPVYEVGEHEGEHYFSMKLIEGGNLADKIPDLLRDQRAAARILAEAARGVHYAHQRGVLHRDLKPANVLIDHQGQPHITDFGLAKCVGGDRGQSRTGSIVGTPSYMAPEQARAEQGSHRSDRYLLPGGRPLRGAHRPAAVPRRDAVGDPGPGHVQRTRPAAASTRTSTRTWRRSA